MRFRFMNQMSKSFRLSGGQSSSVGARQSTNLMTQMPSFQATLQRTLQTNNSTGKVALQRRLLSGNVIQTSRAALVVEGSSVVLTTLEGISDPNLPRGWDAGVMDDDDGG
mmetsp:Transcript_62/g.98  ORF Transcript_62/g.98 Transcript_62/m.98 type:complete len:110 (+) Transcript_62:222-551(+)|eukprot:CAMPEP_0201686824 /NCGR_PEP_ID=MMETSP0578-20130828/1129_1 /ASSEMBLY_ACC=CAM_ASM_000663 /TAXON_ID=267565 /ORGANISM="Skeletonema grethea, Strain CCMP 1804" /LENGTH=109 /DNA_ID=CAMNT_0048170927 /DNA_START=191 /DNA_END=520 /DNA_ORIENTATION=+